ncbi:MAG: hypothetical protein P8163_12285 [Candidatus Thiodiazotropha sp.]
MRWNAIGSLTLIRANRLPACLGDKRNLGDSNFVECALVQDTLNVEQNSQ